MKPSVLTDEESDAQIGKGPYSESGSVTASPVLSVTTCSLSGSVWATVTEGPETGSFTDTRRVFLTTKGVGKSKVQVLVDSVAGGGNHFLVLK